MRALNGHRTEHLNGQGPKAWRSEHLGAAGGTTAKLPFARIVGGRFEGYDLRHGGHPQLWTDGQVRTDTRTQN